MLQLTDVTLTYPDGENGVLHALDSVDLTVPAGQMLGLVGPSGSGKSSLLAVAGALVTPTSGTVHIGLGGRRIEVTGASQAQRARLRLDHIGLVFQQPQLMPSLTALEQLQLVGVLRGTRPRARTGTRRCRPWPPSGWSPRRSGGPTSSPGASGSA